MINCAPEAFGCARKCVSRLKVCCVVFLGLYLCIWGDHRGIIGGTSGASTLTRCHINVIALLFINYAPGKKAALGCFGALFGRFWLFFGTFQQNLCVVFLFFRLKKQKRIVGTAVNRQSVKLARNIRTEILMGQSKLGHKVFGSWFCISGFRCKPVQDHRLLLHVHISNYRQQANHKQ